MVEADRESLYYTVIEACKSSVSAAFRGMTRDRRSQIVNMKEAHVKIRLVSMMAVALVATLSSGCMMWKGGKTAGTQGGSDTPIPQGPGTEWNRRPVVTQNSDVGDRRWKPILFAYDQSSIGEAERPKLKAIYTYLRDNREFDLLIEGHCDERGSEEYNRSLGERRAITVRDYLVRLGLSKSRMQTLSFGEERPSKSGSGETAFRNNRRAELVVISAKKAASLYK